MGEAVTAAGPTTDHGRPRRLRLALLIAAVIVIAMVVDFGIAASRIPAVPPPCATAACDDERNAALADRAETVVGIRDGLGIRLDVLGGLLTLLAASVTAANLKALPRDQRAEAITDLGVAGVVWLVLSTLLLIAASKIEGLLDVTGEGLLVPAALMIGGATLGAVACRIAAARYRAGSEPSETSQSPSGAQGALASTVGLALTALTIILGLIAASGPSTCGSRDGGWTEAVLYAEMLCVPIAMACGVGALLDRRWPAALISIFVPPIATLASLVASACLGD